MACAVLGTGMPVSAPAMAAGSGGLVAQFGIEIWMEGDGAQSIGQHRMRGKLADRLQKELTLPTVLRIIRNLLRHSFDSQNP